MGIDKAARVPVAQTRETTSHIPPLPNPTPVAEVMKWFWDQFLTDASMANIASPLRAADFSRLPPAMIITCRYDILRDEGKAYADKLRAAGVETVYVNYENVHGFFGVGQTGKQAMQAVCDFLISKNAPAANSEDDPKI